MSKNARKRNGTQRRRGTTLPGDNTFEFKQGNRDPAGVRPPSLTRVPGTGGVADTARVTLRYAQEVTLTSTSGIYVSNVFRGNSPFDPDQTGTGGQPVWYDDYSAMYSRYRCLGSRITVLSANVTTATAAPVWVGITPQHVTTSIGAVTTAVVQPYTVYMANQFYFPGRIMTQAVGTEKYLGFAGGMMGSDTLQAFVSASPQTQWYWHVWARTIDASTTIQVALLVLIDYDILFFDKVDGALDYYKRLKHYKEKGNGRVIAMPDAKTETPPPSVAATVHAQDVGDSKVIAEEYTLVYSPTTFSSSNVQGAPTLRVERVSGPTGNKSTGGASGRVGVG